MAIARGGRRLQLTGMKEKMVVLAVVFGSKCEDEKHFGSGGIMRSRKRSCLGANALEGRLALVFSFLTL